MIRYDPPVQVWYVAVLPVYDSGKVQWRRNNPSLELCLGRKKVHAAEISTTATNSVQICYSFARPADMLWMRENFNQRFIIKEQTCSLGCGFILNVLDIQNSRIFSGLLSHKKPSLTSIVVGWFKNKSHPIMSIVFLHQHCFAPLPAKEKESLSSVKI